tara:strand:- start:140 stop:637 length:498 start_codon:yes stop_codon:yes gene_type:complete
MSKQIIRGSRGKIIRTLHKILREVDPQLLADSSTLFDYMIQKGVDGARLKSNYEQRCRRNGKNGMGREGIPYRVSTGIGGDPFILDWIPEIDEENVDRAKYVRRKEASGGYIYEEIKGRDVSVAVEEKIANGENPFRIPGERSMGKKDVLILMKQEDMIVLYKKI